MKNKFCIYNLIVREQIVLFCFFNIKIELKTSLNEIKSFFFVKNTNNKYVI
jgi:hypothetical protein